MNRPLLSLVAAAVLLAGCAESVLAPTGGEAQFALLNALGADENTTLLLDGSTVSLPASGARSSRAIPAGAHRIEARGVGGNLMAALDFTVADGARRSTIIARSGPGAIALLMTTDTASLPPVGAAKVRVIHAVDGVEPMKAWLRLVGAPMDSSAGFVSPFLRGVGTNPEFPGYAVRGPGSYLVTGTSLATGEVLVEGTVPLAAGQVWSAVLGRTAAGALEFTMVREN
ncbi:MAG: hypothetical protein ABIZ70_06285 [Gemmatimonadales bacterium]